MPLILGNSRSSRIRSGVCSREPQCRLTIFRPDNFVAFFDQDSPVFEPDAAAVFD
jgi:hypothetical protein